MGSNISTEYNQQDYQEALKIAKSIIIKNQLGHCEKTFTAKLIKKLRELMQEGQEKELINFIFERYHDPETFWKVCLQQDSYLNFGDKIFVGKYGGMYKINKFGNKVYLPK